jgi:predicted Rossmann-fold nucleotide-binding protein
MNDFLKKSLLHERTIDPQDIELFHFTDDPVRAVEIIKTQREKQQAVENE